MRREIHEKMKMLQLLKLLVPLLRNFRFMTLGARKCISKILAYRFEIKRYLYEKIF